MVEIGPGRPSNTNKIHQRLARCVIAVLVDSALFRSCRERWWLHGLASLGGRYSSSSSSSHSKVSSWPQTISSKESPITASTRSSWP